MKNEGIIEISHHMKVKKWSRPPAPRFNVETLSADKRILSMIGTGFNIDPRGEGGLMSPKNGHIF